VKKKFLKNIFVFLIGAFGTIVYFKILAFYIDTQILAEYFQIKALGLILYYLFSIRYSEFSYILKAHYDYSIQKMEQTFVFYIFIVFFIIVFSISIYYLLGLPYLFILMSYFIFLLNDFLESYVAINRLYHQYYKILILRILLLTKPLLFYYILIKIDQNSLSFEKLFLFEFIFYVLSGLILLIFIVKNYQFKKIFLFKETFVDNIENIKNTWLGSVLKVPYEALPTYLLSLFTGGITFVEYNVARKVYAMTNFANQPFLQILNTYSIDMKEDNKKYLFIYYSIVITLNVLIGTTLYLFGNDIISILSKSLYATEHTLVLIYIMFTLYTVYLMIYPIRQYIVIDKKIIENNQALRISIIVLLCLTIVFIPLYKTYAMSVIQPLGLILPIVITVILLKKKKIDFK
jgi:O-antigen/teichoic acid export membrane protein